MANPFDDANPFDVPEGGASGGPAGNEPSKPLLQESGPTSEALDAKAAEEARERESNMAALSHGQNRQALPEEKRKGLNDAELANALGFGIATARGAPLVGSHIDELSALLQTGKVSGPEYEKKATKARGAVSEAVEKDPWAPLLGSLALSGGLPASAGGRIAYGTLAGVSEGAGSAPNMSEMPRRMLAGGGVGLATSAAAEVPIAGGKFLGGKRDAVIEKAREGAQKAAEKAFASARGAAGAEVAAGSRTLEVVERAAVDESLPEALRQQARDFLAGPEAAALREQVIRSNLGRGNDQLARIQRTRDEMAEAGLGLAPEAVVAAAQKRIDDPSGLLRRIRELGPKVVLPTIGGAIAGPAGAGAGALTSAVLGRSATTVKNGLADPYVATRLLGFGEGVLGGAGRGVSASTPAVSEAALSKWSKFLAPAETKFLAPDEEEP